MKILLTGATGFIGRAVLSQCISNPEVERVIVLSRRPLDDVDGGKYVQDPKMRVIIHEDFEIYSDGLMKELRNEGVQGCIWALGGKIPDFPSLEIAKKVSVDYTLAAANAFLSHLTSLSVDANTNENGEAEGENQKFRFVFVSGRGAEWDQAKKLWVFEDTRKFKGLVEKGLLELSSSNPELFDAVILRPGGVVPDDNTVLLKAASVMVAAVSLSQVAKALVEACLRTPKNKIVENETIKRLATKVTRTLSSGV